MKALYIYNPNSASELLLIERAQEEMGSYIAVISIDDLSQETKSLVRTTPALLIVSDDLQGEELTKEDVDGQLVVTGMLYKRLEEEELCIHQAETNRVDCLIETEKTKAIDDYTEELILSGVIQ